MRKSHEELKAVFEEYWRGLVDHMILNYGLDGPTSPWLKVDVSAVRDCLGFATKKEAEAFIDNNVSPFNIEPFLDEEKLIAAFHGAHKNLSDYHNARIRDLIRITGELIKDYNNAPPFVHDVTELGIALDSLSNLLNFSRLLVACLERWFSLLDISPKSLKNPTGTRSWNPLLSRCVKFLEAKGMNFTQACHTTARVLAIIYPRIWGEGDVLKNGQAIRQKITRKRDKEEAKRIDDKTKKGQSKCKSE